MAPNYTCVSCSGKFGPTMFEDENVRKCRFCHIIERGKEERDELTRIIHDLKEQLSVANGKIDSLSEELKEKLNTVNGKIDSQTTELKALREFTKDNVGVPPPSEEATPTESVLSTDSSSSTESHDGFQIVRNNVRPKVRVITPITCHNRFQILTDTSDEEEEEVRLVGDSMIKGQIKEFCARATKKRKRYCIPGGGVDEVIAAIDQVASDAPPNTTYVVHVGTNDVDNTHTHTHSDELIEKYKRLIRNLKEKSNRIILSGIIPRMRASHQFPNIATNMNRNLANLCSEEGIGFVDTWDHFCYDRSLFAKDGVHLNQVGSARFGRLLNDALEEYRTKNGRTPTQGGTGE